MGQKIVSALTFKKQDFLCVRESLRSGMFRKCS